jgi:hypothetical protein
MTLYHGVATAKIDFESISVKNGDQGILTAYLPEMEKFAVLFKHNWITFSMNEEEFLKSFSVIEDK